MNTIRQQINYLKSPAAIEEESFRIIDSLVGPSMREANMGELEAEVSRRVIHTTGDKDFWKIMRFSKDACDIGISALYTKTLLFTDTMMLLSGLGKKRLDSLGIEAMCLLNESELSLTARERGITRTSAAIELILSRFPVENIAIFAIGNAPTALFTLLERLNAKTPSMPFLIIGTPVGFVGAKEAKELLISSGYPYITCEGTRGGSTIAASIVNALSIIAIRRQGTEKEKNAAWG